MKNNQNATMIHAISYASRCLSDSKCLSVSPRMLSNLLRFGVLDYKKRQKIRVCRHCQEPITSDLFEKQGRAEWRKNNLREPSEHDIKCMRMSANSAKVCPSCKSMDEDMWRNQRELSQFFQAFTLSKVARK